MVRGPDLPCSNLPVGTRADFFREFRGIPAHLAPDRGLARSGLARAATSYHWEKEVTVGFLGEAEAMVEVGLEEKEETAVGSDAKPWATGVMGPP